MEKKHVIVFGGGVAGLTTAHELIQRGFKVTVYEGRGRLGGKARSMPCPGTATPGHSALPGEHGFRFVPGFYRHLPDTMKRIPYVKAGGKMGSVVENLVKATMFAYARDGEKDAEFPTQLPQNLLELIQLLWLLSQDNLGLTLSDLLLFGRKLLILLSSCEDRRFGEWENIAWWDFIQAAQRSPVYQKYLGRGLTRSLVAMKAEVSSTRTVGYILLQLILSIVRPGANLDRLLDGPTNDVWIDPWVSTLREMGVEFHLQTHVQRFNVASGRIASVTLAQQGQTFDVAADHYVAAMPVEVMQTLLTPELLAADPSLASLKELRTDWMNGIQFYLDRDVPEVHGHVIYIDSPWSLTSISQHQFWTDVDLSQYANGRVEGIVSVDISDWDTPGILYNKPARACTRQEICDEVLAQIKKHLGPINGINFANAKVLYWHLDPDIVTDPPATRNLEPLLVNTTGSWSQRPPTTLQIPNLNLASDYVQTYTDLATMEGANEAARRAVNHILDVFSFAGARCQVWPLREPWLFAPLRWLDGVMWMLGLPNIFDGSGDKHDTGTNVKPHTEEPRRPRLGIVGGGRR